MAEGGVKYSVTPLQQAREEMCNVCITEDSFILGQWYCKQCRHRLCDKCRKYHMNVSSKKGHDIIRADEMAGTNQQQQEGEGGISDEFQVPMCLSHNEPIELYCQSHNTPACHTCKLMSHRKCQLQDLENAASGSTGRNLEALQQLRETESHLKKIGEVMGSKMEALQAQKDAAIGTIKRYMKELEALGEKKIAEVEEIFQQEHEDQDREAQDIKKSTKLVEKSIQKLERVTSTGSEEDIFLATRQEEGAISKYRAIVSESSQLSYTKMYFEVGDRLTNITSIGNVQVEKSTISVDITPQVNEVINTKQSDMQIYWFDVLSSDQMIMLCCDDTRKTSQLRLYNASKKLLSQLNLPYAVSADLLDDHQLIVPVFLTQQLQIFNMDNNNLTKGPLVETNVYPWLILKWTDSSVLVLAKESDDKYFFLILDLRGKIKQNTKPCTDLKNPMFMRMSEERNNIYIVDKYKGCYAFNLHGDVIFNYSTKNDLCIGLAVAPHGAIYFSTGECVIKMYPTAQLPTQIYIKGSRPLQCIRNKLYMAKHDEQNHETLSFFYYIYQQNDSSECGIL